MSFLYFLTNVFPIFPEKYIQNPSIFRTRRIFGTLAYLELETFSEPWHVQNLGHIQYTVKYLR